MKKTKKQVAKKAAKPRKHEPIPFEKIAKLYQEGKSMEQIAKAVNRWNADSPDSSKSLRAIVSNMITKGYRNKDGKLIRLKKRPRGKVEPKAVKKAAKPQAAKKQESKPKAIKAGKQNGSQNPNPKPKQLKPTQPSSPMLKTEPTKATEEQQVNIIPSTASTN